ncbi:hypothetical protein K438DRAFT_1964486 [Mycena galopus ATCC 62051]|nr:hypothetical protein K438DRAFT_1964486 [Mycena galopus ATCC 62051]
MPISIQSTSASASSSAASSPSSSMSSASSSSAGVYVPVHKRTASASKPQRTLPIYTPAELLQLAHSPLVKQQAAVTHTLLHEDAEFGAIALSKKQARAREYAAPRVAEFKSTNIINGGARVNLVAEPVPAASRRRPVAIGRTAERNTFGSSRRNGAANKFMDAASWRGQTRPRHVELRPASMVVV